MNNDITMKINPTINSCGETFAAKIVKCMVEDEDNFILETITPFCEGIIKQPISKAMIIDALRGNGEIRAENERLKLKNKQLKNKLKIMEDESMNTYNMDVLRVKKDEAMFIMNNGYRWLWIEYNDDDATQSDANYVYFKLPEIEALHEEYVTRVCNY